MAHKHSYELHHHFPKLAEESGFTFNVHRPRIHIDWNKIRLIDVDNLIRERRFVLIEQHLNDILNCVLESEFDVRILDEGVLKLFRLAQLAVEYQQFCRHYLDRSVYVLREEITTLIQELDVTKKDLREKEEDLRKLKKRTKYSYKSGLQYGNDNIASMILKTLTNKSELFPTTSNAEAIHYNKCNFCDKVFLNQLYLKSHISRRHPNVIEKPQKDFTDNVQNITPDKDTYKLNDEITELKAKLKEMETILTQVHNQSSAISVSPDVNNDMYERNTNVTKNTKDAEVSTSNEDFLLDKIEEWKKEEHEKYNKEINILRTQIIETLNSFKHKEISPVPNEPNVIEQLHVTIQQQGAEILALKNELTNSKQKSENGEAERRKETDAQMSFWAKRAEAQSRQYEALLQKLNDVAKEAQQSRAAADAERVRSAQLQTLLQQNLTKQDSNTDMSTKHSKKSEQKPSTNNMKHPIKKKLQRAELMADDKTLEKLHRKAQELLSIGSTSTSDDSSESVENTKHSPVSRNFQEYNVKSLPITAKDTKLQHQNKSNPKDILNLSRSSQNEVSHEVTKSLERKRKRHKPKSKLNVTRQDEAVVGPGSPVKLVRAKLTEEVNNRLVSVGVDPLKCGLSQTMFQKQRMQLQQQHETKSKKNPAYQKVKHSILAYLDLSTSESNRKVTEIQDYTSPNKTSKGFSLTSVISNVKSKALSLVKTNDVNIKRNTLNAEVAKRAMSLLKTPPGSTPNSPTATSPTTTVRTDSLAREVKYTGKTNLFLSDQAVTLGKEKQLRNLKQNNVTDYDSDENSNDSNHNYYNTAVIQQPTNSVESLIKTTARRPASVNNDYDGPVRKLQSNGNIDPKLVRTQSVTELQLHKAKSNNRNKNHTSQKDDNSSSSDLESLDMQLRKSMSEETIQNIRPKQTKGVLKHASSTSSLNKKKVLFDMDAIQMKSVSASPSQSITDKSDANEKFELGLVNLEGEEWDISSIENEPLNIDTKIHVNSRPSPKVAELKQTIEAQLARRRSETPSTALVGGVDVLGGGPLAMARTGSIAGSNTSLGSSILDESESVPAVNKAFIKPKVTGKDDSELDISEYSIDEIINKKGTNIVN